MLVVATFLLNSAFNLALGLVIARFLGPQGFGQYAIAAAVAVVLNTVMLDWIRLAATRFYSERTRADDAAVRGTLDAVFALSSLGVTLVAAAAVLLDRDFGLPLALAALAPAMAIMSGLFDYHTALARARFEERAYTRLVLLKNGFALLFIVGGAWWFRSPEMVAAGFVLSLIATLALARRALLDPGTKLFRPDWRAAGRYFAYGFPVIAASAIYYLIPLWNRAAIAADLGFGPSGQFSLAYDLAMRLLQTVGSALDILLFQTALRAEAESGAAAARRQLARNMGLVLAAALAVGGGYWLVLPSFEALLVPPEFRGSFAAVTAALLPGLVAFALVQAAVTPVFQLRRRTWPAAAAALAALACNALLVSRLGPGAGLADYAWAQALSYGAGLLTAAALAWRALPARPAGRDVLVAIAATLAMAAAAWPLRTAAPGALPLMLGAAAGGGAFALVLVAFDFAGCRLWLSRRLRRAPA